MALKILQSLKKPVSIKMMIHSKLAGWEPGRDDGIVHASDLMKDLEFCPREWALRIAEKVKPKAQFIGTAMQITFAHGRDMEWRLRNEWLAEVAVGHWKCEVCHSTFEEFGKKPKVACKKCGYHRWEYKEINFISPYSGVTGGVDLLVDVGEPKHRILEIKSMDKDQHKALKAPLAEHKARTSLYLKLAEESPIDGSERINTKTAHIIYVSKSFGFADTSMKDAGVSDAPFSPFKEFVIERDDSLTANLLERARMVKLFRENAGIGMPCGICANGLEKRAQSCSVVKYCWNGTHPGVVTWPEDGKPKHSGKKVIGSIA